MRKLRLTFQEWQVDEDRRLGKAGGFGEVFEGTASDEAKVAVKFINLGVGDAAQRELDFAKAFTGRLTKNIIPILDYGVDQATGKSCIVMARAEENLRDTIAGRNFDLAEAIAVVIQIAKGLLEAEDWIHRDLKPENVLLFNGQWTIADFGIARLANAVTATRTLKGALSPPYAAPEQWNGATATHATDIYALSCIAIELIAGKPPFVGQDIDDFSRQHQFETPTIGAVGPYLRSLLFRMSAKPPVARPTAEQVIAELDYYNTHPQGSGPGANRLAAAVATIVEQTARAQAVQLEKEARLAQRDALREHAYGILLGIAERLFGEIAQYAPTAKIVKRVENQITIYEAALGLGQITLTLRHFEKIAPEVFDRSPWDVICGDTISVKTQSSSRSATLWFADTKKSGEFGWVEAGYWGGRQINQIQRQQLGARGRQINQIQQRNFPCSLPPGNDAVQAALPGLHGWKLAYMSTAE